MKSSINRQKAKLRSLLLVLLCTTFITSPVLAKSKKPEETISRCKKLALDASEMAVRAMFNCDYLYAQQSLNLVNEATDLLAEVNRSAQITMDSRIAVSVYNACIYLKAAISNIVRASEHIASQKPDPDVIHAVNLLADFCESAQKRNKSSIKIALDIISGISESKDTYSK